MNAEECPDKYPLNDDDLRAALVELKAYVDITEEDLRRIYELALRHARDRYARRVRVGEVMTRSVIAVARERGVREAAQLLSEHRISGMPVVDADNRVIGVVSEADILSQAGPQAGHTFKNILRHLFGEPLPHRKSGGTVGDVLSEPAITTKADVDIRAVAALIDAKRIKRLPVVDEQGKIIGIISRGDIVRALSRQ